MRATLFVQASRNRPALHVSCRTLDEAKYVAAARGQKEASLCWHGGRGAAASDRAAGVAAPQSAARFLGFRPRYYYGSLEVLRKALNRGP